MKVAAILALLAAFVSGAWAINDYRNNEQARRDFVRQGITYLHLRNDAAGKPMLLDVRAMMAYYERRDEKIAAFSAVFLIGSIALFWRRSKAAGPVHSN